MRYKILWVRRQFAESVVEAVSEEEARRKALMDEDEGFEVLDACDDWEIEEVTPLPEDR